MLNTIFLSAGQSSSSTRRSTSPPSATISRTPATARVAPSVHLPTSNVSHLYVYININMLPAFERLLQYVFACIFIQIFKTVQHFFKPKACKESKKSKVKVKFSKSNFFFNIQTVFYSVFKIILSLLFVSFV